MSSNGQRTFMLADLDCFFVEVERLHRPELRGRAVAIGGLPGSRGVVAACSYEARAIGIRSAMPMSEAYRRAQAVGWRVAPLSGSADPPALPAGAHVLYCLHEGLHGNYQLYSRRVRDILESAVPVFHAKSIDEFELDVSGCERLFKRDYGGIEPLAEHLRRRVREEVGLPLSIGIGPSRLVAKMASRHAKPDGVYRVLPEQVREFLAPHDVQAVPGIGPATAGHLRDMGINRVAQLLDQPAGLLRQAFGIGIVSLVHALAYGDDVAREEPAFAEAGLAGAGSGMAPGMALRPLEGASTMAVDVVRGDRGGTASGGPAAGLEGHRSGVQAGSSGGVAALGHPGYSDPSIGFNHAARLSRPKSIGHESTFARDVLDPAVLTRTLWRLTEDACQRLRAADLRAGQVTVKLRYSDFDTLTHSGPLAEPSDADEVVFRRVKQLFHEANRRRLRIRLVGVRLERLSAGASQLRLFETTREERQHQLYSALDRIRGKHGRDSVLTGPGVARVREQVVSGQ